MRYSLLLLVTTCTFAGFSQSTTNPGEYMDYFSSEYLQIQKDMWDYTRSVSHGKSARKVEKRRAELIQTTSTALKRAQSAKAYKENTRYRDSVILYFDIVGIVLREDYGKIVDMEEIAEQSYDLMEAYMMAREQASDKMREASDMIGREHSTFAEENDVTLIEVDSKLGNKMEIANKVYDHYNEVYLIFFKSYKQELYLIEAIATKDISAIEQNRNALLETLTEGYAKLDAVEKYEGDATMIEATRELFNFYTTEAEKDIDVVLDYYAKTESFAKVKEAFDKKKEKDRKQEDVDQFNKGVKEINEAVNTYNEMNDTSNKSRSQLIDNWNSTADKFTTKHVPHGK